MRLKVPEGEVEGTVQEIQRFLRERTHIDQPRQEPPHIVRHRRRRKRGKSIEKMFEQMLIDAHRVHEEKEQPTPVAKPEEPFEQHFEERFPELRGADRRLAFQVFSRAAKLQSTLNFATDGFVLGIETRDKWKEFCQDVLMHSIGIASAVGKSPRLTNIGRDITISFSGV